MGVDREHTLKTIFAEIQRLSRLADASDLPLLAYLLDMASVEAEAQLGQAEPRPELGDIGSPAAGSHKT